MDFTDPVSTIRVEGGSSLEARLRARYSNLFAFATGLCSLGDDLPSLGRAFLDGLLNCLGCQRAFILRGIDPHGRRPGEDFYRVAFARSVVRRDDDSGDLEISDQAEAQLFIHAPIVRGATAGETSVERNCLVEVPPPGAEIRRTVIVHAFPVSSTELGAIYLDRDVAEGDEVDSTMEVFGEILAVALPVLKNAYLERRVRELEDAVHSPAEDLGEDAAAGEAVWDSGSDEAPRYHGIVGSSASMRKLFEMVERVKNTDFNVCIFGESGSGKEMFARAIHLAGARAERPFISENCGAIAETLLESELFGHVKGAFTGADETKKGLFELADGGTLFLDEIGDMSEGMQRKLLRVLQEGLIRPIGSKETIRVNVRVICASNRDLKQLIEKGSFRSDLYYRLNVISLEVPPLRERIEDIPDLVKHIMAELQKDGRRRRLSESALKTLMAYNWPGNIRELANVLQRLVVSGSRRIITRKEVLPLLSGGPARSYVSEGLDEEEGRNEIVLRIPQKQTFNEIIAECERAVLINALKENRWNKSRVTKVLKIPRQSLYNKIAKYDIRRKWTRSTDSD